MEVIQLEALMREASEIGKSHLLRKDNFVPGVVYGEGKKTLALKIERGRFIKFMHAHHGGENMVITLAISGGDKKKADEKAVLIKEIQRHPVSGEILHVDFNEISLTKRIEVKVPVRSVGEAVGVKQDGGTLEQILWEVDVECLPTNIPEKLEYNVTEMKIGDTIQVRNLVVPDGVTVKHDPEAIIFSLVPPHKVEEVAPPEGEAAAEGAPSAEPEVIKKEKKAVEGEEEEAPAPKQEAKEK